VEPQDACGALGKKPAAQNLPFNRTNGNSSRTPQPANEFGSIYVFILIIFAKQRKAENKTTTNNRTKERNKLINTIVEFGSP